MRLGGYACLIDTLISGIIPKNRWCIPFPKTQLIAWVFNLVVNQQHHLVVKHMDQPTGAHGAGEWI